MSHTQVSKTYVQHLVVLNSTKEYVFTAGTVKNPSTQEIALQASGRLITVNEQTGLGQRDKIPSGRVSTYLLHKQSRGKK